MTPSLGFIHLLEWLTELRNSLFTRLLDCYKEYNSGTVRKRCLGQAMGKKHRACILSGLTILPDFLCVRQPRSSPNPFLFYGGFVL